MSGTYTPLPFFSVCLTFFFFFHVGENALVRDESKRIRNATVTSEVGVTQVLALERRPYEILVKGGYISEKTLDDLDTAREKRKIMNQKSLEMRRPAPAPPAGIIPVLES